VALIGDYKVYQRTSRGIDSEENFYGGIDFKNAPIDEGFCRMLVNFNIVSGGEVIKPRAAFKTQTTASLETQDTTYIIHHSGKMYVDDIDADDANIMEYILIGKPDTVNDGILMDSSILFLRDPEQETIIKIPIAAGNVAGASINYDSRYTLNELHYTTLENPSPVGIHANVEDNVYLAYTDGTDTGLARLRVAYEAAEYSYALERLAPKDLTPHQAVNYGYNLLQNDPYTFTNSVSSTGSLQLLGVLPYDNSDDLKFNAQVGEQITFKLNYKYPAAAPNYKVQWEVQDTQAMSGVQVIQAVDDSATITPGNAIENTFAAPYQQFSVIVKVYDAIDTTTPIRSIVLANYYLSNSRGESNQNLDVVNYDMGTATGMANFMHKVVLWGVDNAENTLFFSDVNDPTYFPYPQGAEPMNENIIRALPIMDGLLVFTKSRITQILPDYMNGSFTSQVIQENLNISQSDAETIIIIKNMVYFRSNNAYFMVVPSSTQAGALMIAPISTQVSKFLGNFQGYVKDLFNDMYEPAHYQDLASYEDWDLHLQDNYTYLDGTKIKNVYKYKYVFGTSVKYFELVLSYDTMARTWLIDILETNARPMLAFKKVVTGGNLYVNLYVDDLNDMQMQLIRRSGSTAADAINLDGLVAKIIDNKSYLDTGLRNHSITHKKRFRELQFLVHSTGGEDIGFYTEFHIDRITRKEFFKTHTEMIEDPVDPNFGQLIVVREYQDPQIAVTSLDNWTIGFSAFPNLDVVRVRQKVSGKGYSGRLKLLTTNEAMFELLNFNWVYRMMNAR
jgi:hypothetical protein